MRKVSRSEQPNEFNFKTVTAGFGDKIRNITTQEPAPASPETIDRQNRSVQVVPNNCAFCGLGSSKGPVVQVNGTSNYLHKDCFRTLQNFHSKPIPNTTIGSKNEEHEDHYKYIKKQGDSWVVIQKGTGKVLSHHDSKEKAIASFKAMMVNKHGSAEKGSWTRIGDMGWSTEDSPSDWTSQHEFEPHVSGETLSYEHPDEDEKYIFVHPSGHWEYGVGDRFGFNNTYATGHESSVEKAKEVALKTYTDHKNGKVDLDLTPSSPNPLRGLHPFIPPLPGNQLCGCGLIASGHDDNNRPSCINHLTKLPEGTLNQLREKRPIPALNFLNNQEFERQKGETGYPSTYLGSKTAGAWPSEMDWEHHLRNLEELLAETQKGVGWHAAKGQSKEMKAHDKLATDLQKAIDDIKKVMKSPPAK